MISNGKTGDKSSCIFHAIYLPVEADLQTLSYVRNLPHMVLSKVGFVLLWGMAMARLQGDN